MWLEKLELFNHDYILELENQLNKNNKEKTTEKYDILVPIKISKDEITYKLLKEKILDPRVKSIGVTGSYGSGKSSLIETIKKDEDVKKIKSISISLLNFSGSNINMGKVETKTLELEKRILQQILYQKTSRELPLSTFHKIEIPNKLRSFFDTFLVIILFISGFFIKEKYFEIILKDIIKNNEFGKISLFGYIFIILFLFLVCYIFNELIGGIKKLKIKKISPISSFELEGDSEKEKSTLDLYMEDIIYCFESLGIEIMYIEDLDRCDNVEIFIKLRELNILLNERAKNKKITFVYAIKDELFLDKDRSKFFDFIIPIIPILNSSNSEGILREKIKSDFEKEDNDFLSEIFRYVTDMRLGLNICNEYKIYREKFKKNHFPSKNLLAIIVYKNIYPEEFSKANFSTGFLYRLFNLNKENLIKNKLEEIEKEVEVLKNEIEEIENRKIKDTKLLKKILENAVYRDLAQNNHRHITIKSIDINDVVTVEYNHHNNTWRDDKKNILFGEINGILGFDYKKETELIEKNEKNEIKKIKDRINNLKIKKNKLNTKSLANLLREELEEKKKKLLEIKDKNVRGEDRTLEEITYEYSLKMFLFSNGYIDETYGDYLSEFKEGELTKEDNIFIRRVHINDESEDQRKQLIKNKSKVFEKLKTVTKYSMLNISLIDSSINSKDEKKKIYYEKFLEFISFKDEKLREDFLFFLREIKNKEKYIMGLIEKKKFIWSDLIEHFEIKIIDEIVEYIVNTFEKSEIEKINIYTENQFIEYLENHENIFNLSFNLVKLKSILMDFEVKFENIPKTTNLEFYELIKDTKSYKLSRNNIENMYFMETHTEIQVGSFYSDILKTDLINYIYKNIEKFIEDIYLYLDDYSKEEEKEIADLIKNKLEEDELKNKILKLNLNLFSDISLFPVELWERLILNKKIHKTISNINKCYLEIKLESLIQFIADENIELYIDDKLDEELLGSLIENENISIKILDKLIKDNDEYRYQIDMNTYEHIELEKISYLIEKSRLNFNEDVLEELKNELSEELVKKYIMNNKDEIFEFLDENKLDINIFEDDIITTFFESDERFEIIIESISKREWEIKLSEKLIEKSIEKLGVNSIALLVNQVKFYRSNIFRFLEILNMNFKKKIIYLESLHIWEDLVIELEKLGLVKRQKPRNGWELILNRREKKNI